MFARDVGSDSRPRFYDTFETKKKPHRLRIALGLCKSSNDVDIRLAFIQVERGRSESPVRCLSSSITSILSSPPHHLYITMSTPTPQSISASISMSYPSATTDQRLLRPQPSRAEPATERAGRLFYFPEDRDLMRDFMCSCCCTAWLAVF